MLVEDPVLFAGILDACWSGAKIPIYRACYMLVEDSVFSWYNKRGSFENLVFSIVWFSA